MSIESDLKWAAVYGAMVAAQVQERARLGLAPPDEGSMASICEEAEAVADLAEEVAIAVEAGRRRGR